MIPPRPGKRSSHGLPLILLCAVTVGCGGNAPETSSTASAGAEVDSTAGAPIQLPSQAEFRERGVALDASSRAALRSSLGEPDSTIIEVIPNRHVPGVLDTLYSVHYPDLMARIHHPGGGGDLLSMLQVSSNRHLRYPVVGRSVQEIDRAFGGPDEASDSSLTYYCTSCVAGNDPLDIVFAENEVQRVRFHFYVD